jgi:hypothetical protein
VHVANHHIAPGKKQWTWGNHEFGYAWDASLTDADGPYIELMAGVYTDNQPDFAYLPHGRRRHSPKTGIRSARQAIRRPLMKLRLSIFASMTTLLKSLWVSHGIFQIVLSSCLRQV